MHNRAISIVALLTAVPFAAKAATTVPEVSRPVRLDVAPDRTELIFEQPKTADVPTLAAPQVRYVARASGLDRIDPADMKVFGGQIGGNGVQGGAVVSLSWPTER